MPFTDYPEQQPDWIARNMPLVEEHVSEAVLSFAFFHPEATGSRHAFLMVLTTTRLHMLGHEVRAGRLTVGGELAVWDRRGIGVTVEDRKMTKRLVIDGTGFACRADKGAVTDDFVAALGARIPAAA